MHIGISMACINPVDKSRSEARQQTLELSKEYGLTSIELLLEGVGRLYSPYPWEFEETELKEIKDFISHFERKGAHLPIRNMNLIALNERVREDAMEQVRMATEIAIELGVDYTVAHASGSTEGWATDREFKRFYHAFKRLASLCQDKDVIFTIENIAGLHDMDSCAAMIRLLKEEDLPVAMTIDTGHTNMPLPDNSIPYRKYGTLSNAVKNFFDLLENVHLHNNYGTPETQHSGLLEGDLKLRTLIEELRNLDYRGSLTLEVLPRVKDLRNEIETMKRWSGL